ncbi:hypothetical protein NIES4101_81830 [Calothrix sp. NIES-4101]|nr:hypothetical protein NIES4101_81830 [Calothrix sp. NIES-4101]
MVVNFNDAYQIITIAAIASVVLSSGMWLTIRKI